MTPHEKQIIDQLAELRRFRNRAELEATRWLATYSRRQDAWSLGQVNTSIRKYKEARRDVQIFEEQLTNETENQDQL